MDRTAAQHTQGIPNMDKKVFSTPRTTMFKWKPVPFFSRRSLALTIILRAMRSRSGIGLWRFNWRNISAWMDHSRDTLRYVVSNFESVGYFKRVIFKVCGLFQKFLNQWVISNRVISKRTISQWLVTRNQLLTEQKGTRRMLVQPRCIPTRRAYIE